MSSGSKEITHQEALNQSLQGIVQQREVIAQLQIALAAIGGNLKREHGTLAALIRSYNQERHQRQEAIWTERGLVRCTGCYNVGPDDPYTSVDNRTPTDQGGWGLVLAKDVRYVELAWYDGRSMSSGAVRHSGYHCLCPNCYEKTVAYCQKAGYRSPTILSTEDVDYLNKAVDKELANPNDPRYLKTYTGLGGLDDAFKVWWRNLEIPEAAYEIGRQLP